MERIVYYHKGCSDGFGAAWAAWKRLGPEAEYIPLKHGDEIPEYSGCQIYFLDICPSHKDLVRLECNNRVVILDHHKTAEEIILTCKEGVFDLNRSGAGIAWDYFCGNKKRPKLIDIVEDRDLWNWNIFGSKEVLMLLDSLEKTFESWDDFASQIECSGEDDLSWGYENAIKIGASIVSYQDNLVKYASSGGFYKSISGTNAFVVNSPILQSFIGNFNLSDKEVDLVAIYSRKEDGFAFSLRSNKSVDCSKIAEKFGGGGHQCASGFFVKSLGEVFDDNK